VIQSIRNRVWGMVQDKILCFVCAVKGIERTFATYYELQDHLYKDHDMTKDPAMEIFTKYRASALRATASPQSSK